MTNSLKTYGLQGLLILGILIVFNLVSHSFYTYADLTEDKRFSLEPSTVKLLEDIEQPIYIEVLLEGELSADFKNLQQRTEEVLNQLNNINREISFQFSNPSRGTTEEINMRREQYRLDGIFPTTLFITENDQRVEKLLYPYAIVNYGDRKIPVNLLEPIGRNETNQEAINKSSILLEYKLASTIAKLDRKDAPVIMFTSGQGELGDSETAMLETLLSNTMSTGRLNLDSIFKISEEVDVLVVARPTESFSQKSKFLIDQYIMNGGKVIWLIDQFFINLDSINNNKVYIPRPIDHQLDDLFFKYGVRINKNVVLDLECSTIPQVYGLAGNQAQQQLFPWVFHPLLQANLENDIVKNIDRISSTFPATIEVLNSTEGSKVSTLVTSSQYSRYQVYPSINVSFEILRVEQRPEAYNKPNLPIAVMIEGEFESLYKNRVTESMSSTLNKINATFKERSDKTQQVFVGDGDIVRNLYDSKTNRISPMGYNKWEGFTYEGNKDFIINVIDYMVDDYGLVASRSKNFKLRLLDQVKLQSKLKWQLINILLPILLVIGFGFAYNYVRKRKYA